MKNGVKNSMIVDLAANDKVKVINKFVKALKCSLTCGMIIRFFFFHHEYFFKRMFLILRTEYAGVLILASMLLKLFGEKRLLNIRASHSHGN